MPIIKQTPENRPRCLLSVTASVDETIFNGSEGTMDAVDIRRGSAAGVGVWRR